MIKDKVLDVIKAQPTKSFTRKKLFDLFDAKMGAEKQILEDAVRELVKSGEVFYDEKSKRYELTERSQLLKGKVQGAFNNAYGFFINDDGGDDLFIAVKNLNGAINGDRVLVRKGFYRGKEEAEVVKILERGTSQTVGEFFVGRECFVVVDDLRFSQRIYVDKNKSKNAKKGQKVLVKISHYTSSGRVYGEVVSIIGDKDQKGVDVKSVAYRYGFTDKFSEGTQKELKSLSQPTDKDFAKRRDLSKDIIVTIDGEDARDFDDAISCSKKANNFLLGVHIADVSHYVKRNSEIDKDAYKRATSVYYPECVFPMLPEKLSNDICSLVEKKPRLTLSVFMEINPKGDVVDYSIEKTFIVSKRRMTYTEAFNILTDNADKNTSISPEIVNMLLTAGELAKVLQDKRGKRGAIEFGDNESQFILNEKGKAIDVFKRQRNFAHELIEEFMILANETVATYLFGMEYPTLYRVHERPKVENMIALKELLALIGIKLKDKVEAIHSTALGDALKQSMDTPFFSIVNKAMLRSMQKAVYSPENSGHFGLCSSCYCHFTSPIRRYPDLIVHRCLSSIINADGVSFDKERAYLENHINDYASHTSQKELDAERSEREVDALKRAEVAYLHINEDFSGIISGVTERGIFVMLSNTIEGFIDINLLGTGFTFEEKLFTLSKKSLRYTVGDKIDVTIIDSNLITGKVYMALKKSKKNNK